MRARLFRFVSCFVGALSLGACGSSSDPAEDPANGVTVALPEPAAPEMAAMPPAPLENMVGDVQPKAETAKAPEAPDDEAPDESADVRKPSARETPAAAAAPEPAPKEAEEAREEGSAPERTAAPSARLPLSNAVVAQTLDRIGFRCGSVVSTTQMEGPGGRPAYRVSCSSGQSYRASDESGRFRFKQLTTSD